MNVFYYFAFKLENTVTGLFEQLITIGLPAKTFGIIMPSGGQFHVQCSFNFDLHTEVLDMVCGLCPLNSCISVLTATLGSAASHSIYAGARKWKLRSLNFVTVFFLFKKQKFL